MYCQSALPTAAHVSGIILPIVCAAILQIYCKLMFLLYEGCVLNFISYDILVHVPAARNRSVKASLEI